MRLSFLTLGLIGFLTLSSCATQRFVFDNNFSAPNKSELQIFVLNGIGQTQSIDAKRICGSADNIAAIEFRLSPLAAIINLVFAPLFTPREAQVYCKR